jgi:hypothetical protein
MRRRWKTITDEELLNDPVMRAFAEATDPARGLDYDGLGGLSAAELRMRAEAHHPPQPATADPPEATTFWTRWRPRHPGGDAGQRR